MFCRRRLPYAAYSCSGTADAVAKSCRRRGRGKFCGDAVRVPLCQVQHVRESGHLEEDPGRGGDIYQHHGQHPGAVLGYTTLRGGPPLRTPALSDVTQDYKYLNLTYINLYSPKYW